MIEKDEIKGGGVNFLKGGGGGIYEGGVVYTSGGFCIFT